MKKRYILTFPFLTMLALSSCGGATNPGDSQSIESVSTNSEGKIEYKDVELNFWHPITGSDYTNLSAMIAKFNQEYEGKIKVKDVQGSNDQTVFYNNFELSVSRNRGPDIAILHNYKVLTYSGKKITSGNSKGKPQFLSPLQPIITEANKMGAGINISGENYIKGAWDNVNVNDDLWAVPFDVHTTGIYYNKALMAQYNIEVPTNRNELIAASKKIQTESGTNSRGEPNIWGMPMSYASLPQQFSANTSYIQNGGQAVIHTGDKGYDPTMMFKDSANKQREITSQPGFLVDNVGRKSTRMISDLIYKEKISNHSVGLDANLTAFKNGSALFCLDGLWNTNEFKDSLGENGFGIIPMSKMFAEDETNPNASKIFGVSHTFVIPRGNDYARGKLVKGHAALEFINWMGKNSIEWAKSGQIPAYNEVRSLPEYEALKFNAMFGDPNNFVIAQADPYFEDAYGPFQKVSTEAMSSDVDLTDAKLDEIIALVFEECKTNLFTAFRANTIV
ncbi:MAG: extracellular solute-binding protein [Bacilli bacterium]